MSGESRVRVGLIGAGGNMKARHIPGFRRLSNVDLVAVANRSRASGEKVASEFGIARVYDTWQELLKAADVDAVCIGTWPYMHCEMTLAALEAGKHVLCEARMAMNAREARTMLEASRRHPGLVTQIVPGPPTLEVDSTVVDLLKQGYFGSLKALELSVASGFADPAAPLHWRQDASLSGMNILTMGIWYECIQRWLGQPESVMAMAETAVTTRRGGNGQPVPVTIPDQIDVLARFFGGVIAHLRFSSIAGLAPAPEVWMYGTEATVRFDAGAKKLFGGRKGDAALTEIVIPKESRVGWRVEEEFISAIQGKEKVSRTSFEDGVRYMEFTEAVNQSLKEGRAVAVKPL